jgi:uncharacterized protein (DUF924 family)
MSPQAFRLDKTIWNATLYKRIQEIWFGGIPVNATQPTTDAVQRWFRGSPDAKAAFDELCRSEFDPALKSISPTNYPVMKLSDNEAVAPFLFELQNSDDAENARIALSFVVLFDQISRNIYRTKETLPMVYEQYDRLSNALIKHIISTNPRLDHHPSIRYGMAYRMWFYFPLMHSEDPQDHKLKSQMIDDMERDLDNNEVEDCKPFLNMWRTHEQNHAKLVEQFGRYPHRNGVLGREATKEEDEYLKAGGETFGVAV